jgi:hypothetical protein
MIGAVEVIVAILLMIAAVAAVRLWGARRPRRRGRASQPL